eukprot:1232996-Amorphochlora_amoeboformis.AAC.1
MPGFWNAERARDETWKGRIRAEMELGGGYRDIPPLSPPRGAILPRRRLRRSDVHVYVHVYVYE